MDMNKKFEDLAKSMVDKTSYQFIEHKKETTKKYKLSKTMLIASIIIFTFITAIIVTSATPLKGLFSDLFGGMGLRIAESNSNIDYPLVTVENQGITMKVISAVSGQDRIILNVNFMGLNNVEQYLHDVLGYETIIQPGDLKLVLESGESLSSIAPQDCRVIYGGAKKEEDGSYSENFEIIGNIENSQKVKLDIEKILDKSGQWIADFDLTFRPYKVYSIDKEFDVYNGKIQIKNVIMDSFSTTIEFTADCDNDFWEYYLPDFETNKQVEQMKNFNGVTRNTGEKGVLSDGTEGYRYIMIPIPEDAVITMSVRYLDDLNIPAYTGKIDLKDYN